jgi:hypothetical protein
MVLPFVLPRVMGSGNADMHGHAPGGRHSAHMAGIAMTAGQSTALLATLIHTLSYIAVSGAIAYFVYRHLGVRFLRTAWINLNVIWAVALIVTAVATPLV